MLERMFDYILPGKAEFQYQKPDVTLLVKLPLREDWSYDYNGPQRLSRQSMHTDMMGIFTRTLRDLKFEVRRKLLIEGRDLTEDQWERLRSHSAYNFFFSYREDRGQTSERRKTLKILMPKDTKVTLRQVRSYYGLDFKPSSLAKQIGFKIAWYPADELVQLTDNEYSFNSLAPYLGAVNQFRIGSSDLKPGIVRMIATRMAYNFEQGTNDVVKSVRDTKIGEEALEASSKIFKISL